MPIKTLFQKVISTVIVNVTVSVPILITVLLLALTIINPPFIDEYIETLLVDYRFKVRNVFSPPPIPDDILIVAIDEDGLAEYGRWPWNRRLQADLIEKIFQDDPRVVAVNIFYPEAELPGSDRSLAEVFDTYRDRLVISLGFEVEQGKTYTEDLIEDVLYDHSFLRVDNLSALKGFNFDAYRVLLPPEPIASSASYGHVYSLADRDGKVRWENPYLKYGDEYFPSLALQAARITMGVTLEEMSINGGEGVYLGDRLVPTDEFGRIHINYLGREGSIHHVSAADVISGRTTSGLFKNKSVFIGTTAMGTYVLKNTPFSANLPGVEMTATVADNIIRGKTIKKSSLFVDLGVVLLIGMASILLGRRQQAFYSFIVYAALAAILIIMNLSVFTVYGLRVNLTYPIVTVIAIGTFIIGYRYLIEEKSARNIKNMFSSYVTERVVNELIKNPDMARLGGERREVTLLFSDIRDFTAFTEKNAPEEVVSMLNEYLTAMTEIVFRWEGTLDKFIGDAIVAFWNAPLVQENHAERALRCTLHMINRLGQLREKWESEGKVPFDIGIGINTGEVIVGNIGAEGKKMDYTVIGDHVNLCARIEPLTKKYKTKIIISEFSLNKIRGLITGGSFGHVSIRGLEQVVVKGKELPVCVYEFKSLDVGAESVITEAEDRVVHMKEK